jgi:hypothetical protein
MVAKPTFSFSLDTIDHELPNTAETKTMKKAITKENYSVFACPKLWSWNTRKKQYTS